VSLKPRKKPIQRRTEVPRIKHG